MLRFIYFVLLFSPSLYYCQHDVYSAKNKDALFFWDGLIHKFVVIDDSTAINIYNEQSNEWKPQQLSIDLEFDFHFFLKNFIPVSRNQNTTLFVHRGGGIVLELNGKKIVRIDHSFAHVNQYGGSFFSYHNEPYIFGGYGLFSFKNFIIRYDTIEKEWFKSLIKNKKPQPRRFSVSIQENDKLFLFGGEGEFDEKYTYLNDAWSLDLKKLKWNKLGLLNPVIPNFISEEEVPSFSLSFFKQLFLVSSERIYEFFPRENKVRIYSNQIHSKARNIVQTGNLLLIKSRKEFTNTVEFYVVNSENFFKDFISEETYIYSSNLSTDEGFQIKHLIGLIMIVLFGLILFYVALRKKSKKFKMNMTFNSLELRFLELLKVKNDTGVSLMEINDLINFGSPTFDTLKKRREIFLRNLKNKLEKILDIPADEIFQEVRNEEDKRMKSIKLNQELFHRLENIIKENN